MRLVGRLGIKVPERTVPRRAKIGVAVAVVLLSALVGFPVFELISPIGAVNKGLVFGGLAGAGTLLAIVIAELLVSRRLWCRALCPLGGTFQVLGCAGQVNVAIDHDACIHCDKCTHVCLADPVILAPALAGEDAIVRAGRLHGLRRLRGRMPHFRPAFPPRASPPARFEERCKQGVTVPFLYRCCPHEYERNCPFSVAGFTA